MFLKWFFCKFIQGFLHEFNRTSRDLSKEFNRNLLQNSFKIHLETLPKISSRISPKRSPEIPLMKPSWIPSKTRKNFSSDSFSQVNCNCSSKYIFRISPAIYWRIFQEYIHGFFEIFLQVCNKKNLPNNFCRSSSKDLLRIFPRVSWKLFQEFHQEYPRIFFQIIQRFCPAFLLTEILVWILSGIHPRISWCIPPTNLTEIPHPQWYFQKFI